MSKDGGTTWHNTSIGLYHNFGVANIAIDPRDGNTLYAIINPPYDGSYLRRGTTDGYWTNIPTPLNNSQIGSGMTLDRQTGALYVSVFNRVYWELWRTPNPTVADVNAISWEFVHRFIGYSGLTVLASGTSPQGLTLYVRLMNQGGKTEVQRSADGGKTWAPLNVR